MSIFLSPLKIFTILIVFCFLNNNANAWSGFDYDNQTSIEISSGNLVREGNIIDFYQQKTNELLSAKVLNINYFGNATELTLQDLHTNQKRVVMMQN
jgi:hypothetical protein